MKTKIFLVALTLAAGIGGAAAAETYTCKMKPAGKSHSIPTDVIIGHDVASASIVVNDNFIQHYVGNPIAGVLKSKTSNRILVTYTVPGVKNDSGQYTAGLIYSINIQLPSGTATMTGKPQGYANSWRGSGTCTVK